MKKIVIFMKIISIFLLIFNGCAGTPKNNLFGIMSEKNIGKYILKNTPLGSSRDDIRAFVEKKGYEIIYDKDSPHILNYGTTIPEQPPQVANYFSPENRRGAKHIFVNLNNSYYIVSVGCAWVFCEDEKLLFVEITKEWNTW